MFKEKDFVLQFAGLFLLTGLAVLFGVFQYRSGKEIIDVGIIIGIVGSIVGNHAYNAIKKSKNDETSV